MTEEKQIKKINPVKNEISQGVNRDTLKWIIIGLVGFGLIVLIFGAGIFVGEMKARFSYRWAESYHKNFAGPKEGFFGDWRVPPPSAGDFIEGHGVFGQIMKIGSSTESGEGATLVIKGRDDMEKIVLIKDNTVIKSFRETIKFSDLKVDDYIVIIGEPNDAGQIEAKFIRVAPPPSMGRRDIFPNKI
jgi:hypothetical protein